LVLFVARVVIGGVFVFSAYQKLRAAGVTPEGAPIPSGAFVFALAMRSFDIVPEALVPFAAYVTAWCEGVIGLALVVGLWTRAAGLLSVLMLVVFTSAVASVILRQMDLTCGCFGKFKLLCEGPVGWCKVGENLVLVAIALLPGVKGGGCLELAPTRA
jgi:uncharacterized membrane protein YphA (DoxX/SURF4 family)